MPSFAEILVMQAFNARPARGDSPNWRVKRACYYLYYEGKEICLPSCLELKTVRDLKDAISKEYGVPPLQQRIDGWKVRPSCDEDLLVDCSAPVNHLTITKISEEDEVVISFLKRNTTPAIGMHFESGLTEALTRSCFVPVHSRKVLLLFLYKEGDEFSRKFCRALNEVQVQQLVLRNFSILAWDISDAKYHRHLKNTLNSFQLEPLSVFIECRKSAAFCLQNVEEHIGIACCLSDKNSQHILVNLKKVVDHSTISNSRELELRKLEKKEENQVHLDVKGFQQMMAVRLVDRDYDRFEFDQMGELFKKIGFARYGPPENEKDGYDRDKKKDIEKLHKKIIKEGNRIAEYRDLIDIAFIYNCIEPLPEEKITRSKQYKDYNPNTDYIPIPLFVLRKCRGSQNPCRVFIDHTGRVYSTWNDFIQNNKLPKRMMHLPLNGKYQLNKNREVVLQKHLSASCSIAADILTGVDYTGAGIGITSAGIFAASMFTPLMPAVLITAMVGSGIAGAYSIGRSIHTLVDKGMHRESLSFLNSEARGAYINIVAGTLGFTGMGATVLVENLIGRGVNITNGASYALKTLGVANITAGGVGIVNSSYEIVDGLTKNQTPSPLMILQLSSSVLFFGNAIYNYNALNAKIDDSQKGTLQRFVDNLKANMYKNIFENMVNDACPSEGSRVTGQVVVQTIRTLIPPVLDVIRFFQDHEEELKSYGAKFTANNGEYQLNGETVDMDAFNSMDTNNVNAFRGELPIKSDVDPEDTSKMMVIYSNNNFSENQPGLFKISAMLLNYIEPYVQEMIVKFVIWIWDRIPNSIKVILEKLLDNPAKKYVFVFERVFEWLTAKAEELEEQYEKWEETSDPRYYSKWFCLVDTETKRNRRKFFETVVRECCRVMTMTLAQIFLYVTTSVLKKLYNWLNEKITEKMREKHSAKVSSRRPKIIECEVCKGYYYSNDS